MKKYKIIQSQKMTLYENITMEIEAQSEEEAKKMAIEAFLSKGALLDTSIFGKGDSKIRYAEVHTDFDTMEAMSVEENGGYSTIDLYFEDITKEPFYSNNETNE